MIFASCDSSLRPVQTSNSIHSLIFLLFCRIYDNLKKAYSGNDGNSEKYAVRGLSLAVP